jgi:hypothetical protein
VRAKKENLMADFSRLSTKRSFDYSPINWKVPFRVILAAAAFALAGCTAIRRSIPPDMRSSAKFTTPTTMRMIPPNTRRQAASTLAVVVAVEAALPGSAHQDLLNARLWQA